MPKRNNPSMQPIRREVDWAWLAGVIDGEGNLQASVKIAHNGKPYFRPKIRIANTDVRMIRKIAELYSAEKVVFFYTVNQRRRYNANWKDQLHIEVASQGSGRKILERVIPHLANKQHLARILLAMIAYVQRMPKGGNTLSIDYVNSPKFQALLERFNKEAGWHIEPSTTTRRAGEVFSW